MNIAEQVGGIGVLIMTFRTQFEEVFDDLVERENKILDSIQKIAAGGELQKSFQSASASAAFLEKLHALVADIDAARKLQQRCRAAFPDFARHVLGQHCGPSFSVADKSFDIGRAHGESTDEAARRGAIVPLFSRQPIIDPGDAAADAALRHRHDGKRGPE